MAFKSFRDRSREAWGREESASLSNDDIKLGAILRIADATEKMAQRHTELIAERDRYERWYRDENSRAESMRRTISSLRGVITKLKKRGL